MALSINWNDTYESTPTKGLNRSALDNEFRKLKRAIREVMEREHNWGPYTDKDDGTHIPGKTGVLEEGDSSTRDGLGTVHEGSLYLLDNGSFLELQIYIDGSYESIGVSDHGELSNILSNSGHTQYVRKDDFVMTGALDMGGNSIVLPLDDEQKQKKLVAGYHYDYGHPGPNAVSAIPDDFARPVTIDPNDVYKESVSGDSEEIPNKDAGCGELIISGHHATIDVPMFTLFPHFYAYSLGTDQHVKIVEGRYVTYGGEDDYDKGDDYHNPEIGLYSDNSFSYRVNYKYIKEA